MATSRERERREGQRAMAQKWAKQRERVFEATSVKLPEGVKFWKPDKPGIYKLDVIPYVVGVGNPNCDEGMVYFERTYHCHRGLGPDGKSTYLCNKWTFKDKCYPCDWILKEGGSADRDFVQKLRVQDRLLMNVFDVSTGVPKQLGRENLQVLDQPYGSEKHPNFGQILKDKIQTLDDYADFAELDGGWTLVCKVIEDSFPGGKFLKVSNIEFVKRKYKYPEKLVSKAVTLDDCLIQKTYEEMKAVFHGEPTDDESNGRPVEAQGVKSRGISMSSDDDEEIVTDEDVDPGTPDPDLDDDQVEVGDTVTWHSKGKKYTGEVKKIYDEDDEASVLVHNEQKPRRVRIGDLTINEKGKLSEDDEDLDDEPKTPVADDDEDPFSDEVEDKDDLGFDEDETFDDEPETPVKKTTAKKPPQRGRR
jgi:hypothetical protein